MKRTEANGNRVKVHRHRLSEEERRKVFFYADTDADLYDITEELTQPYVDLIHSTMVQLIVYSLRDAKGKRDEHSVCILDVGSGTGAEAFGLFAALPECRLVALDFSRPMNEQFKRKFAARFPTTNFSSRVTLLEEDFFSEAVTYDFLKGAIPKGGGTGGYDAVITGFMFHHYTEDEKMDAYQRFYGVLKPGGILVHGDLFCFQSPALSRYAHEFGERWIVKQLSDPDPELAQKFQALRGRHEDLRVKWVEHWNMTHRLHPVECAEDGLRQARGLTNHAKMLLEAGFEEVGCPFRLWEAGVLWARK